MNNNKYIVNPEVVLREEFDDWAILFNPENGEGFGINPVGVQIWKLLDGLHDAKAIIKTLKEICDDVPEDAEGFVGEFLQSMFEKGLIGVRV